MIDQYTISAVIGYYRSGASIEQIMWLMDDILSFWEIEEIILSITPCVIMAGYDPELKSIIVQ